MRKFLKIIWLVLASLAAFGTFKIFSFCSGNDRDATQLNATTSSSVLILIFTIALTALPIVLIFLKLKKEYQIIWIVTLIIVAIVNIILYCFEIKKNASIADLSFTALVYFFIPIFLILAMRMLLKQQDKSLLQ